MFATEKAGAGSDIDRVEKVKGQPSSRPRNRQRSSRVPIWWSLV